MATTAKGTPYVESSDLVADYPTVSLALAEHIDDLPAAVLQVVGALTATGTTTTSTTFVNTDLSVNITPQFATSKILIFNFNQGLQFTNAAGETIIEIARNTTSISALTNVYSTTTQTLVMPASIGVLDSPSTTSAITYRTRIRTANSSNSAAINGQQHLIAIEVSA